MDNQRSSEHGQALILLVLGVVVLLGFTALAVDGGMVYSDRRHAQMGSDASSLAGGGATALYLENHQVIYADFNCSDPDVVNAQNSTDPNNPGAKLAAIERASDNDYIIDEDLSDMHGVETDCGIEPHSGWDDKYIDIETQVTRDTETNFAHFVFAGLMRNSVQAITRVRPRTSVAFGNAIVATRLDCPNNSTGGVHFNGGIDLTVNGGGIFSNACLVGNGGSDVGVTGGEVNCVGVNCDTLNGGSSVSPAPNDGADPLPPDVLEIPPPDCSLVPVRGSHTGSGTINPGRYTQIRVNNNDTLTMNPGLYCLSDDFEANGGTIVGSNLTIFMTAGNFDISGNVDMINITAPPARNCDVNLCPPAIPGVLVYLAEGNDGEAHLTGNSVSEYRGIVYAPNGTVRASGDATGSALISSQLVGDTVILEGNVVIDINFDDEINYQVPARIELYK